MAGGSKRLYHQFKPSSYELELSLSQKSKSFSGKLQLIGIKTGKPSSRITLHQHELKIDIASIRILCLSSKKSPHNFPQPEISRVVHHNKLQEIRIHFKSQLPSGHYQISLQYSGQINQKQTNGIYPSTWHDDEDQLHELVSSQFQPYYARSLLPCIDEPEAKAELSLSVQTPESEELSKAVYSNMPLQSKTKQDDQVIYKFKTSPGMSPYLYALISGNLSEVSTKTSRGVKLSIVTIPNKKEHTKFALELAPRILDFLESYFQIEYPLPKCDLAAIPDLDAGGMENWGLITFREDLLLFDEESSTLADKQAIALVLAHELAHQWFGNLVTMKWWDELWLNEGFANFMEHFIVDHFFPEWKIFEEYLVSEKSTAMHLDSLLTSKAIVKKIHSTTQINEAFDEIAYEKSGTLIRMLYNLLGPTNFQNGLRDYFKKYQFSNATSQDLISAWQKYTKLNLPDFIQSWLYQPGYPLVKIKLNKNHSNQIYQIEFTQKRFLSEHITHLNPQKEAARILAKKTHLTKQQREFYRNQIVNSLRKDNSPANKPIWRVPINFISADQTAQILDFVMKKSRHILQLKNKENLPLKLNRNGTGLYLTDYPVEFIAQIITAIRNNKLPETEILNLLADFIILSRSSKLSVGSFAVLDILKITNSSLNPHFWSLAGGFLSMVNQHLKEESQEHLLQGFITELIQEPLKKIGLEFNSSDSDQMTFFRFEILSIALLARDPNILRYFQQSFDSLDSSAEKLYPESRILTLFAVAKRGLKKDFNQLLEQYNNSFEDISLREDIAYALSNFEDQELQAEVLSLVQNPELVRSQDILSWLSGLLYSSKSAKEDLVSWLKLSGWNWLKETLSPTDLNMSVRLFCSTIYNNSEKIKLLNFFKKESTHDLQKSIQEAAGMARTRVKWHSSELPAIIEYLSHKD